MTKRSAGKTRPRVLIVEADRREANRLEGILRAEFDVIHCPGPSAPEYTCPGGRGEHCTFACEADVIVLDEWVEGDTFLQGTTGWELLFYYRSLGKVVVVLAGEEDALRPLPDSFVLAIGRAPDRDSLLRAVRAACARILDDRRTVTEAMPDAVVPSTRGRWRE